MSPLFEQAVTRNSKALFLKTKTRRFFWGGRGLFLCSRHLSLPLAHLNKLKLSSPVLVWWPCWRVAGKADKAPRTELFVLISAEHMAAESASSSCPRIKRRKLTISRLPGLQTGGRNVCRARVFSHTTCAAREAKVGHSLFRKRGVFFLPSL